MAQFSDRMVPEVVQVFWAAMARGEFITHAAAEVGTYREKGMRWLRAEGGVRPRRGRDLKGRCLTFSEREEIAVARAGGESMRSIARRLGRHPSTVSRELARNAEESGRYRATTAHARAYVRASRPKPSKLAVNLRLRRVVEEDLQRRYSPEQIVGRLRRQFPDDPEMRVSPETIYQSLICPVARRVAPRSDQVPAHRAGAASPVPPSQPAPQPDPGHDQHLPAAGRGRGPRGAGRLGGRSDPGQEQPSAIGTLVERTTGYTMLVHLPDGFKAEQVRDALTAKIKTIPDILRASLTWDQGIEMHDWKQVSVAADIDIYFCDPHSPWQRATCENTNGLLRQYFPKGTDLSVHSAIDLEWVATELNDRPRKRLGFAKPIEEIGPLLLR